MVVIHRYCPKGKFVPLHDIDFYSRFDIIALLQDYEKNHPTKRIHKKTQASIEWARNEMAWLGIKPQ